MAINLYETIIQSNDMRSQLMADFISNLKMNKFLAIPEYVVGIENWIDENGDGRVPIDRVIQGYVVLESGVSLKDICYNIIAEQSIEIISEEIDEIEQKIIEDREASLLLSLDYDPKDYEGDENDEEDPIVDASLQTIYLENLHELKTRLGIVPLKVEKNILS